MKAVMISIQPKWAEKIANGEKTIEVRKTRPKIETPFKCYIYCTKGENLWLTQKGVKSKTELAGYLLNGKVIGEFVCDWITEITPHCDVKDFVNQYIHGYPAILDENDCLSFQEIKAYLGNKNGYDWHISDLHIYDKPKELSEFTNICPDKFHYCEICKYGSVVLSPDEEEYALYHGGHYDCYDTVCHNIVTRPPQSWQYVEELTNEQI